jgi:hypothetical protein
MPEAGLPVNLAPGQLARMSQLSDQWSFLWDKRRSLWIAAEDCPDGEQIEEDLGILLAQLPVRLWLRDHRNFLTFLAHTYSRHTPTARCPGVKTRSAREAGAWLRSVGRR